ncbi:peptidoglycan-binding domain-containing protein [Streptomyces taklimakanensis]|nr:peptidoglycan-binding domain-containing protein [Streptomyces taklimakanensis]
MRPVKSVGLVAAMVVGLLGGVAATPSAAASWECDQSITVPKGDAYLIHVPFEFEPIYTGDCFVRHGARGGEVSAIQRSLRYCYGRDIVVDGVFGDKTLAALKNVQSRIGVASDGVYGPRTRDAMSWPRYHESTGQIYGCVRW